MFVKPNSKSNIFIPTSSKMSNELVFITGATGHIRFKTLVDTLEAGYSVRAAIRSEAKFSPQSPLELSIPSRLTFVIVPDLTVDGAYDESVKGATYIIHLASPIVLKGVVHEDYQKELIDPRRHSHDQHSQSSQQDHGNQAHVITSYIVAIIPSKYLLETEPPVFDHTSTTPFETKPYASDFHATTPAKSPLSTQLRLSSRTTLPVSIS
jgi:hypothetical protein